MNEVTIEAAITILAQIAQAVQAAVTAGKTTIDATTWNAAITARDAALAQLDADIAAVEKPAG